MTIPLTILGGYLGAGKTTLLNKLLSQSNDTRLAVLVNDFGSINIDASLIENDNGSVITLTNGCVCCSLGDDLGEALHELLQNVEDAPEGIIIEASGASDPYKVGGYANGDPRLELAKTITVVDSETIRSKVKDKFVGTLVQRQIKSADLLVLTKGDLLDEGQDEGLRDWLADKYPAHPYIASKEGQNISQVIAAVTPTKGISLGDDVLPEFSTASFEVYRPLDGDTFRTLIAQLPDHIVRAKGFVELNKRHLLQKTGDRVTIEPDPNVAYRAKDTQLVFISVEPDLDKTDLLKNLHALVLKI
jgi:G3E family GTPase